MFSVQKFEDRISRLEIFPLERTVYSLQSRSAMPKKNGLFVLAALLLALGCSVPPHPASSAKTIDYCDLPNHPGEWVRIKANYREGFEWSELGDPKGCLPSAVWVEYSATPDPFGSHYSHQMDWYYNKEVELIAVGRLETAGGYGHENFYPLQFVIERLERVVPTVPVPTHQEMRYRR